MYDKIQSKLDELYDRLDNLEGCEDNPIYKEEIRGIRDEITELNDFLATEFF